VESTNSPILIKISDLRHNVVSSRITIVRSNDHTFNLETIVTYFRPN